MDSPTVTVRGQAVVSGKPDEARLALEIKSLYSTPQEALADVAARSEELEKVLDELDVGEEDRTTSGVTVREERDYSKGEYIHRGYIASNMMLVTLNDARIVGRLMREATNRSQARISGPRWQIALDNPARAEAYRQAAANARSKGEAYVEALGARLGAVVSVAEPGLGRVESQFHLADAMAAPSTMADAAPTVEVHAGDLDISALVEVVFRIEQR
jgi:uncharacterized protein YggE